jgi:3-oxoacyl-(acyl-carrier-protein) synthase
MGASRLLSSLSPDGVIPGEGAAFMRVSADPIPGASVYVAGVELATEEATRASGRMTGRAQAAAARSALAAAGSRIEDVGLLVKDTSGERHRFYETALAVTRLRPSRAQTLPTVTLGSSLGEVGCALGAISVAYAAFAVERGWTPAKTAMYLGASEGSLRAAVVLRKGG